MLMYHRTLFVHFYSFLPLLWLDTPTISWAFQPLPIVARRPNPNPSSFTFWASSSKSNHPSTTSSTTSYTNIDISAAKQRFQSVEALYYNTLTAANITIPILDQRIEDLQHEDTHDWKDAKRNQRFSTYTKLRQRLHDWENHYGDAVAALEMLQDHTIPAAETPMLLQEFHTSIDILQTDCEQAELEWLVETIPYHNSNARMLITAGAGGTEANDWVEILYRMYEKCDIRKAHDISIQLLETTKGDEVGYKSVELLLTGINAYGWFHGEKGTHRLVRLSPFNALHKRQTTFAAVDVYPDLEETFTNEIIIDDKDLHYSYFRASGKGGQNVNKVSSAVRLLHKPTNISTQSSQERSQILNKRIALHRLKSVLLSLLQTQQLENIRDIRGDILNADFGSQIRNYILHPYQLVKDTRSQWSTSDATGFLNGKYGSEVTGAYLRQRKITQEE